jgi:hypothetical protein
MRTAARREREWRSTESTDAGKCNLMASLSRCTPVRSK